MAGRNGMAWSSWKEAGVMSCSFAPEGAVVCASLQEVSEVVCVMRAEIAAQKVAGTDGVRRRRVCRARTAPRVR
jgi:hypothetical protein